MTHDQAITAWNECRAQTFGIEHDWEAVFALTAFGMFALGAGAGEVLTTRPSQQFKTDHHTAAEFLRAWAAALEETL